MGLAIGDEFEDSMGGGSFLFSSAALPGNIKIEKLDFMNKDNLNDALRFEQSSPAVVGTKTRLFPLSILLRTNPNLGAIIMKSAIETHLRTLEQTNHAAGDAANSKSSPRSAKLDGGSSCLCANSCSPTQIFKRRRSTFHKFSTQDSRGKW